MKICKIRCNSSAQQKHQYIYQSVAPQFSSRLLSLALWCQKFDSVMSGQSDANLRIIGIQCVNTESCSASHKWIALHCCVGQSDDWGFGPGQWCPWGDDGHLLTHSRSLDYNTWRRTHKPTAQYIDLYSHTQCTQATHTVYKQYTSLGWSADGPIHGALLTLGHWDNYQGSSHSIQPWVMWRLVGWNIDLFYSLECQ